MGDTRDEIKRLLTEAENMKRRARAMLEELKRSTIPSDYKLVSESPWFYDGGENDYERWQARTKYLFATPRDQHGYINIDGRSQNSSYDAVTVSDFAVGTLLYYWNIYELSWLPWVTVTSKSMKIPSAPSKGHLEEE